ncbi:hypothetical protein [Kitasatospora sp. NBC_01302]|uniref:hypothetical protein n=1 Tax=Kitasatospora sp. NBC_01302 TaxID=2903575 RepID=UPI002E0FB775|nr:hypothetical protein OG294_04135 [Kitasatospora sp. NBC_01302]
MPGRCSPVWPDGPEIRLVAVGVLRIAAGEPLPGTTGPVRPARAARVLDLLESWLAGPSVGGAGPRECLLAVLDALARRSAGLVVALHQGNTAAAKARLGEASAAARQTARADGDARPPEPAALALVWLAVEAAADAARVVTPGPSGRTQRRPSDRFTSRYDGFVRDDHLLDDTCALLLAIADLTTATLTCLLDEAPDAVPGYLDRWGEQLLRSTGEAAGWVPDHPGALIAGTDGC